MACRQGHPFFRALLDGLYAYPNMNTGDKHRYAENIYLHYNKSSNSNGNTGTQLHIETNGKYFFPTFDPMLRTSIKKTCRAVISGFKTVFDKFRQICDYYAETHFENMPSLYSYTNHFWVHLDGSNPTTKQMKHVDVRENVKISTRMVDISAQLEKIERGS